jgi:hypothetical protein
MQAIVINEPWLSPGRFKRGQKQLPDVRECRKQVSLITQRLRDFSPETSPSLV